MSTRQFLNRSILPLFVALVFGLPSLAQAMPNCVDSFLTLANTRTTQYRVTLTGPVAKPSDLGCSLNPAGTNPVAANGFTVPDWSVATLDSSFHGSVLVQSGGILHLGPFAYRLKALVLQHDVQVVLDSLNKPVSIWVRDTLAFGDRSRVLAPWTADSLVASWLAVATSTSGAISIGYTAQLGFSLLAPNASVTILDQAIFRGTLSALSVTWGNDTKGTRVLRSFAAPWDFINPPKVARILGARRYWTAATSVSVSWTVDNVAQTTLLTEALRTTDGSEWIKRCPVRGGTCDSVLVLVDRTPPVVQIVTPPNGGWFNTARIGVRWKADGVERIDSSSLTEGANVLSRSSTDSAGNVGAASVTVKLDTKVPVVAITSPLTNSWTNKAKIVVTWSVDGVSHTDSAALVEGANTITRSSTDSARNVGAANIVVKLDTKTPVVTITSPLTNSWTNKTKIAVTWSVDGVSRTDSATLVEGANTITRSSTDSAGNAGLASIVVKLDSKAPVVAITSPVSGSATILSRIEVRWTADGVAKVDSQTLALGANTVTRSVTDSAGNIGSASVTVNYSPSAPVVVISSPLNNSWTNKTKIQVNWTADGVAKVDSQTLAEGSNTVTRSWTGANGLTGAASIVVKLDTKAPVVAITSPVSGMSTILSRIEVRWTVDGVAKVDSQTLALGANTVTRSVTDSAGNMGSASVSVYYSPFVPVVVITSPLNNSWTNKTKIQVNWTADGVAKVDSQTLAEGTNTVTRSWTGANGLTGAVSITVKLDTKASVVAITSPLTNSWTNKTKIAVTWSVDGISRTDSATLVEGANTITRSSTDSAGNVGATSVTVKLDTKAPVVAITSPLTNSWTNKSKIAVTWSVDGVSRTDSSTLVEGANTIARSSTDSAGNVGAASIVVKLDTKVPVVAITSPLTNSWTNKTKIAVTWSVDGVSRTDSAALVEGANAITRSSIDSAGNVGAANIVVKLDTKVPVVAITSPLTNSWTNKTKIAVTWSVDGVSRTDSVTLVEGANTITRSSTDSAGNVSLASIVVKLDTKAPVVAITSPVSGTTTSRSRIEVRWTVDGVAKIDSQTLVLGANTVTRSSTDSAGNIGSASLTITYSASVPVVVITSPLNNSWTNKTKVQVNWIAEGVAKVDSQALVEGANTVTRAWTGANGLVGTASVVVKLDAKAPVVAILSPVNHSTVNMAKIAVIWAADGVVQIDSQSVVEGANTITRSFIDSAGNAGSASVTIQTHLSKTNFGFDFETLADSAGFFGAYGGVLTGVQNGCSTCRASLSAKRDESGGFARFAFSIPSQSPDGTPNYASIGIALPLDNKWPTDHDVRSIKSIRFKIRTNTYSPLGLLVDVDGPAFPFASGGYRRTAPILAKGSWTWVTLLPGDFDFSDDMLAEAQAATSMVNLNFVKSDGTLVNYSALVGPRAVAGRLLPDSLSADPDFTSDSVNVLKHGRAIRFTVDPVYDAATPPAGSALDPNYAYLVQNATIDIDSILFVPKNDTSGGRSTILVSVPKTPVVVIQSPANNSWTKLSKIAVHWSVNGIVRVDSQSLTEGMNAITRSWTDSAGNIESATIVVKLDTKAPVVTILSPLNNSWITVVQNKFVLVRVLTVTVVI